MFSYLPKNCIRVPILQYFGRLYLDWNVTIQAWKSAGTLCSVFKAILYWLLSNIWTWHMRDWIKGYKLSEAMIHSQRSKAVRNGNLTQQAVPTSNFAPTLKVFISSTTLKMCFPFFPYHIKQLRESTVIIVDKYLMNLLLRLCNRTARVWIADSTLARSVILKKLIKSISALVFSSVKGILELRHVIYLEQ